MIAGALSRDLSKGYALDQGFN